jgi:GT2 family glycosyltransferase
VSVVGHEDYPDVDIVTVTYNSVSWLEAYLQGLRAIAYPSTRLRLFIVDNASTDETVARLRPMLGDVPFPARLLTVARNEGFGAACNRAASLGSSALLLFLNPDARPAPEMLDLLVARALQLPRAGLIEAAQWPRELRKWRDPESNLTDWCSCAAVIARRDAFVEVGGFDPLFFLYAEDVDLSWRMWLAGRPCVYVPEARVNHAVSSRQDAKPIEKHYTVCNSFAMRFIYDSPIGLLVHVARGGRYLVSARTEACTRRSVAAGLWRVLRSLRHLLKRRLSAQRALRSCSERARIVFTEWHYGRWLP